MYNFCREYEVIIHDKPPGKIIYCFFICGEKEPVFKIGIIKSNGKFEELTRKKENVTFEYRYMP